jgi:uncharacterized protein (DUF849 family)
MPKAGNGSGRGLPVAAHRFPAHSFGTDSPEMEIFDTGMVYNALYYVKQNALEPPLHFQFVLGAAGGMTATVENLVFLKSLIRPV